MSMEHIEKVLRKPEGNDAESKRLLKELNEQAEDLKRKNADPPARRITVNKRTHRIRFEGETEDEVTIVVEKREG